jgi:hypothetical protein
MEMEMRSRTGPNRAEGSISKASDTNAPNAYHGTFAQQRRFMAGSINFAKLLFLLFFFQDVFNVALAKFGLIDAIGPFSSLKEVIVVILLIQHWLRVAPGRELHFTSASLTVLLALLFTIGVWRGLERFPLDGVVFELRTLTLPILIFFWGRAFVETRAHPPQATERMIRFYTDVCILFAASGIVDYLFLDDIFWTWVDIGAVSRAKGYVATSSGALPDNMYSFFFGRRAFGLAFNPLNLAYMLIPALVFAFYRRQIARLAVMLTAFILSFSRLPILAAVATIMLAMLPRGLRLIAFSLGGIGVGWSIYIGRETLFTDPSARGHFADVAFALLQQVINPLGQGVGAAGIYAGNYSSLSVESAVLNVANQITVLGLVAYLLLFAPGLSHRGPLHRELRVIAAIYGITAVFAPQILVIKSTFVFFFLLGANAALSDHSTAWLGRREKIAPRQLIGFRSS